MKLAPWIGSIVLFASLAGAAFFLVSFRKAADAEAAAIVAAMPEPTETIGAAEARAKSYRRVVSVVGTVKALRSISIRTELPGAVAELRLEPGAIVEAGALLVALDTTVEEAELNAHEARAALSESNLARMVRAGEIKAASDMEVDKARAERDVARAEVARFKAVIERKKTRAPFRGRLGLTDVHLGQYLDAGATLTTLQSVDDAVHVEFAAPQDVAAGLKPGDVVDVSIGDDAAPRPAKIVAVDARVDAETRNATVRARLEGPSDAVAPGAATRVLVPAGEPRDAIVVPAVALRRSPEGAHVFVLGKRADGRDVARLRPVVSGPASGEDVYVFEGLKAGERVATKGSFKLHEGALVHVFDESSHAAVR